MNSASHGHAAASAALIIAGSDIGATKCACGTLYMAADTCYYCRHGCGRRFERLRLRSHKNMCARAGGRKPQSSAPAKVASRRRMPRPSARCGMLALLSAVCAWVSVRHWSDGLHMGLNAALSDTLVRWSAHGSGCGTGPTVCTWVSVWHWFDGLHMGLPSAQAIPVRLLRWEKAQVCSGLSSIPPCVPREYPSSTA
jgi:hypothetical protein